MCVTYSHQTITLHNYIMFLKNQTAIYTLMTYTIETLTYLGGSGGFAGLSLLLPVDD